MKNRKVTIELRGRQFTCPHFSSEHAMYFGTLLMDEDELRVFREEEDPERAMSMMSERLKVQSEAIAQTLENLQISKEMMNDRVNNEVISKIAMRLMVRINQDMPSGTRYAVAARITEVFPSIPTEWVNRNAINLEPHELVSALVIPLFGYLVEVGTSEEEPPAPPEPLPPQPAKVEPIPAIPTPPSIVEPPTAPVSPEAIAAIDNLPEEAKKLLGITVK